MQRIVAGYGGWGGNDFALCRGIEFAMRFGAELLVVYADGSGKISQAELEEMVEAEIDRILPEQRTPRRKLLVWRAILYNSDIAYALTDAAAKFMADMVIIGAMDRSRLATRIISELSPRLTAGDMLIRQVVLSAQTPILIDRVPVEQGINRILAVVDLGENSQNLINYAAGIAREFMSDLMVLYVLGMPTKVPAVVMRKALEEYTSRAKDTFDEFIAKMKPTLRGLPIEPIFRTGNVAEEVIETIRERNIDLLISNLSSPNGWIEGVFGTPAEHLALAAESSVLLLPVDVSAYESLRQTAHAITNV